MSTLTKQLIVRAGLEPAFAAAAGGGDEFVNTGNEYVELVNGSASPIVATFVTQATVDGLPVDDRTVTIPAGERRKVGFWTGAYNDDETKVQITYDGVDTLTIGIFSYI